MPRGAAEVGAADALPGRGEFKHHVDAGLAGVGVIRFARDSPLEGDGFEPSVPAREITLRDCLLIEEVRFAADSPQEGGTGIRTLGPSPLL